MTPEQKELADKLTSLGRIKGCECGHKFVLVSQTTMESSLFIECEGCGFKQENGYSTESEAIKAWNELKCAQ